jgi:beta-barrel assembly-enhancing protease
LFFSTWFILAKVDWISVLHIKSATDKTEKKLGELFWKVFKKSDPEYTDNQIIKPIDSIVTKICVKNKIDRKSIQVHVLNKDEVNAFALPDGHLIVYSGLILASENEAELSGVLGHEMAHIQQGHVMKKLVKEIGLSVLISITAGGGGTEVIKEAAKLLSSSAFDRDLEKEADLKSVDYLLEAKIDPNPFANFLYRLSNDENDESMKYLSWASTHPDSKERAKYIIEHIGDKKVKFEAIMTQETWDNLQKTVRQ